MQIEGREVSIESHYLDPVTYVPRYAKGNAGHKDCVLYQAHLVYDV